MADKITNDITLLFKTKLDEKSKQEVGKNLKSLLENAAIGFDEAETKRNLEPIIRMMKKLFDKAEIAFDADQLLAMPSRQALQKMAEIEVGQLQIAFDKALAKSGGIKLDFGDMDLSAMTEPLEKLTQELSEIGERVASTTKKSVREIENTITSLSKTKKLDETVEHIEKTLESVNNPKHYTTQNSATKALEKAREAYSKSVESNDPWEKQYQHLLKFVSRYESMTKKVKPLVDESNPEFKSLYEQLVPKAGAVKISLEHLIDLRQGKELTEYKNQPWARESTLKKIEQTLRSGITVKEGAGDNVGGSSDDSTPPWEDSHEDLKSNKFNTKVPPAEISNVEAEQQARIEAEKKAQAEKAAAEAAEQRRIEEEKTAEAAKVQKKAAEEVVKVASEPVLTELEQKIIKAVEDAKSKSLKKWENAEFDDKERLIDGSLSSNFPSYAQLDEDSQYDFILDLKDFSDGKINIEDAAKSLGRLTMSLEELYNASDDELKQLIQEYAKIEDSGSDESFDLSDQIADESPLIDSLIRRDINDEWTKLKDKLLGKVPDDIEVATPDISQATEADVQAEVTAHEANTSAIVAETNAQKELNEVKAQYLLPQKEDFVAGDMDPSDEQKEKVLALGEEYRAILSILEKGDSELTAALKERANAIMDIMQKINIQDGFMDNTYRNTYGGDFKTASELMNWQKADSLFLENYDSSAIDDSARQAVIDLIHQEIEARKQSIEVKREENAVDQQQNIDALKSKYESATEQEKALVQDIVNIRKDEKHLEQFDDDASEEALDKLISERLNKARALREVNKELWDAITSIGRDELVKHIDTATNIPVATSEVAATSDVSAEAKDSIQAEELRQLLNSITYNVKVVQDAEPAEDNKISIDETALESVLNRITYNVKIAHDDADKTANKIAIDEGALEGTLKRVFANVLNPEVEQAEAEPKNEPWALNDTLLSVKEVLDGIHTNTAKAESVEIAPANTEVGNVLATENTLAAIKTAVEAINKKVVKGTKAKTSESHNKETTPQHQKKNAADTKELIKDYIQLGKLRAQFEKDGNLETKAMLQNIASEVERKRESLQLTTDEIVELRKKSAIAYEAEKKLLDAAEAQKRIDDAQNEADKAAKARLKESEKETKARLKEETKLTKKQALTGKAGNAIGRAEGVWMEALSLDEDSMPQAFIERINEYNKQLDVLRKKHLEISSSKGPISKEQQKDLINQTTEIHKHTAELGELISEYQRLSGANTTAIGASTLEDSATISEYEKALKQAVMTATNGKAQIKNFDHDTKTLTYTLKTGKNEFTEYTAAVRHLDKQYTATAGKTKRMETFLEATRRKMKELTSYFSGMAVFNQIGQELRRGIQYVREIDLALTELKKVTDETEESYDKFLDAAAKTGARLGTTISAVTEATATFAKLGYSMEQATEMAESAIVYKNVGDNIASTEDAADSIISTMKGFRLEATESMAIVDRFNEVGNRFAITSQGIGEALRLSASALSEGGNSLDESIGLITAANEVVGFMPHSHSNMVIRSDLKRGNS